MSDDDECIRDLGSKERAVVRAAAKRALALLRNGHADDPLTLGEALVAHVSSDDESVKHAVAEACEYLPDPIGENALAILRKDRDGHLQRTAARSTQNRATKRTKRSRTDDLDAVAKGLFEEIEKRHKKGARRLAERAARRVEELAIRRLYHELGQIMTPLEDAVTTVAAESRRPRPDLAVLARASQLAAERLAFQWSIIQSAHDLYSSVRPVFRTERLADIVDEAHQNHVKLLGQDAARLAYECHVDAGLCLDAHRPGLVEALQNVLKNAGEAFGETGPIAIGVSANDEGDGSRVVLQVRDAGVGMDEETLLHIDVPYGSKKRGGTGVGVLVARKMVCEVHGGAFAITSKKGEGSTVTMTLPVKQRGAKAAREDR